MASIEIWVVRFVAVILLLLCHDSEASAKTLMENGSVGFGLLLDAVDLKRAISQRLASGRLASTRRIRRYKATFFRMQVCMPDVQRLSLDLHAAF